MEYFIYFIYAISFYSYSVNTIICFKRKTVMLLKSPFIEKFRSYRYFFKRIKIMSFKSPFIAILLILLFFQENNGDSLNSPFMGILLIQLYFFFKRITVMSFVLYELRGISYLFIYAISFYGNFFNTVILSRE